MTSVTMAATCQWPGATGGDLCAMVVATAQIGRCLSFGKQWEDVGSLVSNRGGKRSRDVDVDVEDVQALTDVQSLRIHGST